ncbi:cytochrome c biogenesis protein CcsA [Guyparkeria hydrothermalis]|uniref:cytochrome C assembly family protein n=1 Tax=Guyparkeria hydrothermalis TaxID=923 RepID=UPI0020223134|nr:cytochrome c biogenesis protein CcsA [Guyparkeria hydrothermalis]
MDHSVTFLASATITGFVLATILLLVDQWQRLERFSFRLPGLLIAVAALIGQGALLYQLGVRTDPPALNLSVLNALATVFWLASAITVVSTFRERLEGIAVILLPITALTVFLTVFVPESNVPIRTGDLALDGHILISLTAYALLTLAALQGVMLLIQHQALHGHHPAGWIRRLPPMESVEQLMFRFIVIGFLLLTLALVTGFLFLENIFAQHLVHKTVLSVIAWLVFAVLLVGRHVAGWRGRTAVQWTLAGFILMGLAYFGTKIVLEWILDLG